MQVLQIFNTVPDKDSLLKLLANISDQCYLIGIALEVPNNVLNGLLTSPRDNKVKLIQVIKTWLTSQPSLITWKTMTSAIEGENVENLAKADEIRDHLGLPKCQ